MAQRGSSGGRRRRRSPSPSPAEGPAQLPFAKTINPLPPMVLLSEEAQSKIEAASFEILENIGINFLLPEAREILAQAGADVSPDSERVRFDRDMILTALESVPTVFDLNARNPDHAVTIGANNICFTAVSSPPNVTCLDRGRRTGNFDDYCNLLRLFQSLNAAQLTVGYPVEPIDVPPAVRHLRATQAKIELTDKVFGLYSLGRQRVLDVLDMVAITHGRSRESLTEFAATFTNVNANSPLTFDRPMLWGMIEMARHRQPVVVTPFTLAGAMAPVTLAGALAQQNAEALAGIAFIQIVNPGAPCVYGGFTSNVDMKSGSPAFGTPEYSKAVIAGGQLARRYGIPYRSSNVNASNASDVQAAYESQMSLWAVLLGGANLVYHGLGWLEGGLAASFEKAVIDAEMIQGLREFLTPIDTSSAALAVDAIADVGPGGHFFGTAHTLERYATAFYAPMLSDWRNFENWADAGSQDATQRANTIWKKLLADYEAPALDPAIQEQLAEFVDRRSKEGGVKNE